MRVGSRVISMVILLALLAIWGFLLFVPYKSILLARVLSGTIFIFLIPGYLFMWAIFGDNPPRSKSIHYTFTVMISFGILHIGGLILNALRVPLSLETWIISLLIIIAMFGVISIIRNPSVLRNRMSRPTLPNISLRSILLFHVAIVLTVMAYMIAVQGVIDRESEFTQLWSIPREDDILIGVRNDEGEAHTYYLELEINSLVRESYTITLDDGEIWQTTYVPNAGIRVLTLNLYNHPDDITPYRSTYLNTSYLP